VQRENRTQPEGLATDRASLQRRALRLEYATIAWNIGEAALSVGLGLMAGSLALIGFGTVSVVEVFASSVVVWHLGQGRETDPGRRGRMALRLIALAFAALAAVLTVAAVNDLTSGRRAGESPLGIAYLTLAALVMFSLALTKHRTATLLGSAPLASEAKVTFLDGVLSTSTLVGLALNAYLGWWWADPAAALVVAIAAVNEARETWTESNDLV
jgi:divalent metal cation (Fe/Co/Zn/Cd) transporter